MNVHFTKMQGLGNDYVYVDAVKGDPLKDERTAAVFLSDRHFGVGSDGLIVIAPSDTCDFKMVMYNADGSKGEMCGNGIRCIGKYVYDHGLTEKTSLDIETGAGIRKLNLHIGEDGKVSTVTVAMGQAVTDCRRIPVTHPEDVMIGQPLEVKRKIYNVTCVSMGNPHCVVIMENDTDIAKLDLQKIGPAFENHPIFPKRINTEFINIRDRQHILMRVWERGSGETLACGTGACAAVVASFLNGKTDSDVDVSLLGGHLSISYDEKTNDVTMTGPAVEVYSGDIVIPEGFEEDDVKIYVKD